MKFIELFVLSIKSLLGFKMRSFLTTLGIIVGIASVVMISSLGAGFQETLIGDATKNLSKMITVSINELKRSKVSSNRDDLFTDEDIKLISSFPDIESAFFSENFGTLNEDTYYSISALDKNGVKAFGYEISVGREFTEEEYKGSRNVAMLSRFDAIKLFGSEINAIGKKVEFNLNNEIVNLTILGTYKDFDENTKKIFGTSYVSIIVPLYQFSNGKYKNSFMVVASNEKTMEESVEIVKKYLNIKAPNLDIYDVKPISQEISQVTSILDKISIFISLVAGISLAVGGIGVMNIMLVSVTERISEIGLRKAIGAKNKDILFQFLIESITLTLIGGIIGLVFGYVLAFLIGSFFSVIPILKINVLIISLIVSMGTGLIFGIYPAKKAAKLSPMEALRSE